MISIIHYYLRHQLLWKVTKDSVCKNICCHNCESVKRLNVNYKNGNWVGWERSGELLVIWKSMWLVKKIILEGQHTESSRLSFINKSCLTNIVYVLFLFLLCFCSSTIWNILVRYGYTFSVVYSILFNFYQPTSF